MNILVTGATGLIGKVLCQKLANDGHRLSLLSRGPKNIGATANVRPFHWEAEQGPPPKEAWEGVEAVIHLAGESVASGRWTEEKKRRIRNSRGVGTRNLVGGMGGASRKAGGRSRAAAVGECG